MLKKGLLLTLLAVGALNAEDESVRGTTLVGVEVGYVGSKYDVLGSGGREDETVGSAELGLKVGGEKGDFRFFLDGHIWHDDTYETAGTVGAAFQYLFRPSAPFSIFLGGNVGVTGSSEENGVYPYYGADLGVTVPIDKKIEIEVGGRYCDVFEGDDDYALKEFYEGYVSVIFRFESNDEDIIFTR